MMLRKDKVLRCQNGFATHIVGIKSLPSSRQGAAVEYNVNSIFCGIGKNIFVDAHGFLFVTAEKVNLYGVHALVTQPFHFFFACYRAVHFVGGALHDVVPMAA